MLIIPCNVAETPDIVLETVNINSKISGGNITSERTLMSEYEPIRSLTVNDWYYEVDENMTKICESFKDETVEETVNKTLNFVSTNYEYRAVDYLSINNATAIYHGYSKEMVCKEYSTLAIALLRCNNISSCEIIKYDEVNKMDHSFIIIWFGEENGWVKYEPQTGMIIQ